jgi:hypothetical protein
MSEETTNTQSTEAPWASFEDFNSQYRGFLIGNREGLKFLQRKIDEALAAGSSKIEEADVVCLGVQVLEKDPNPSGEVIKSSAFKEKLDMIGCFGVILAVGYIFIRGIVDIVSGIW